MEMATRSDLELTNGTALMVPSVPTNDLSMQADMWAPDEM